MPTGGSSTCRCAARSVEHGFLLGEHDWWGKARMPWYNETAHIPFFCWDPRTGVKGVRRRSLTTTIDVGPTLLDYFAMERPPDMDGKPLPATVEDYPASRPLPPL